MIDGNEEFSDFTVYQSPLSEREIEYCIRTGYFNAFIEFSIDEIINSGSEEGFKEVISKYIPKSVLPNPEYRLDKSCPTKGMHDRGHVSMRVHGELANGHQ